MDTRLKPLPPISQKITTLTSSTTANMEDLRKERQDLMERRIELLARKRQSTHFGVIRNFLSTPHPPTPIGNKRTIPLDYSWINGIVLGLVFDAVREVEISKPSRAKTKLYNLLHDQYEKLVETFLSKAIKQKIINELFNDLWTDVIGQEMSIMVKQCVGDITIAESLASSLILIAISSANRKHNPLAPKITEDNVVCKSLMTELRSERERRKDQHIYHTLQLIQFIGDDNLQPDLQREPVESLVDADKISSTHLRDIQCLELLYLPNDFEKFSEAEVKQWETMKVVTLDLPVYPSIINNIFVSPSSKYAAISCSNYLFVVQVSSNKVIRKNSGVGDILSFDWSASDQYLLSTNDTGRVVCWQVGCANTFAPPKTGKKEKILELVQLWSFEASDLRIEEGNFAQDATSELIRIPIKSYFCPLYTSWGSQPIILAVCQNTDILRICRKESRILYPPEMPKYQDIQNITVSNLRLDIFKGHKSSVHSVVFRDEASMLSFDESSFILEWEYATENFDAFGYVIPKRYIVSGNEIQYIRLIKGVQCLFDMKGNKTRQETLQAAKNAEDKFNQMRYGKSPYGVRLNSGFQEETYVRSYTEGDIDVSGVVIIRKILGKSLFSMKKRYFKEQSNKPHYCFGSSLSSCKTLITYSFLFKSTNFRRPHISFLTLRTSNLSLIKNKIHFPITEETFADLNLDPLKFTFATTPPNNKTKSSYIIFRLSQSLYIISIATSKIVVASFDVMSLCAHNEAIVSNNHISQSLAGVINCQIWGDKLLVYGTGTKQGLLLSSGLIPDGKLCGSLHSIDPGFRRFFSDSYVVWDGASKGEFERNVIFEMCRDILLTDVL